MNHLPEETSDLIHRRLLSIGALPIHQFASFGLKNISTSQPDGQPARRHDSDSNLLVLTTACLRQFGKSHDVLKTEFLQHSGSFHPSPSYSGCFRSELTANSAVDRQCILTIQLPGGPSRSYKSEPFPDSEDAVEGAAYSAIKDGALDFILFGENEILKLKSNTDEVLEHGSTASSDELEAVETLEECWRIWRGDASHLLWFRFDEVSVPGLCGCALKVELTPHCYRVYSSQLDYADLQSAKTHCARNAIANGALHFIQHGDGQIEPRSCPMSLPASLQSGSRWNLQNFFESFARPSAEEFSSKSRG
ncbi:unnamed protein product [Mycena citricolor]|uniref:Uncharacterized protein n=1 Tax=Mycena citricolor TaxID=2018698 RepID=A0AAD2HF71_9AGAR|nr:unnamed protein product [Mycena citricolor]